MSFFKFLRETTISITKFLQHAFNQLPISLINYVYYVITGARSSKMTGIWINLMSEWAKKMIPPLEHWPTWVYVQCWCCCCWRVHPLSIYLYKFSRFANSNNNNNKTHSQTCCSSFSFLFVIVWSFIVLLLFAFESRIERHCYEWHTESSHFCILLLLLCYCIFRCKTRSVSLRICLKKKMKEMYAVHIYFMRSRRRKSLPLCVFVCVNVKTRHHKRKDLRNIIKSIKYEPHICVRCCHPPTQYAARFVYDMFRSLSIFHPYYSIGCLPSLSSPFFILALHSFPIIYISLTNT